MAIVADHLIQADPVRICARQGAVVHRDLQPAVHLRRGLVQQELVPADVAKQSQIRRRNKVHTVFKNCAYFLVVHLMVFQVILPRKTL